MPILTNPQGFEITWNAVWSRAIDPSRLPSLTEEAASSLAVLDPEQVFFARVAVLFAADDGFKLAFFEDGEFSNCSVVDAAGRVVSETGEPYLPAGWAPVPAGESYTAEQMRALGFEVDPFED
jgi:hypothetical protein